MEDEQQAIIDRYTAIGEAGAELFAAAGIPGVSLVAYLLGNIRHSRNQRTESLYQAMGDKLDAVRAEIDVVFVKSDEFEALTEEILEKGSRRREIDKRDYYAAAFANSALPRRPAEAERYRLIDTLERMRKAHLWLLAALLAGYTWPDPGGMMSGFESEFKRAVPEADMDAIKLDWRDLEAAGLVERFPSGSMSSDGARNFRAHVTDLGRRFHQFVVLPFSDVHPPPS